MHSNAELTRKADELEEVIQEISSLKAGKPPYVIPYLDRLIGECQTKLENIRFAQEYVCLISFSVKSI